MVSRYWSSVYLEIDELNQTSHVIFLAEKFFASHETGTFFSALSMAHVHDCVIGQGVEGIDVTHPQNIAIETAGFLEVAGDEGKVVDGVTQSFRIRRAV